MPSYPLESAATYLDANPFQIRNTIIARHEAIAGAVWAGAGLLFGLIGTVRTVRSGRTGYLIGSVIDIIVLLAAALVVWRLTIAVTARSGRWASRFRGRFDSAPTSSSGELRRWRTLPTRDLWDILLP
jgi:hypothetical protein